MPRIGLLSDTHGFLPPESKDFFSGCDEIWHAGDIGSEAVVSRLQQLKPLRAVHGNIDGIDIRLKFPEKQLFSVDGLKVLMVHIGGTPGKYEPAIRKLIQDELPGLVITGHSHILKVKYDSKYHHLHINPGAAGISGFHQMVTMVRFTIDQGKISHLEIFEKPRSAYQHSYHSRKA